MNKILVAPSILSADFSKMGEEVLRVQKNGADLIHCDVMDGVFVNNITFGIKMIADIKKLTALPLDVHLMIVNPQKYVQRFVDAGADFVTFHVEACDCIKETLQMISQKGCKCGIVLKPNTDVEVCREFLPFVDMILLMSVEPGFGAQKFIEKVYDKIVALRKMIDESGKNILLEIDGGINDDTMQKAINCGADTIVAGNYLFKAEDMKLAIEKIKSCK